jgi:hypothetical protein
MTDRPPRVLCTLFRNSIQTFNEFLVDLIANSMCVSEGSSEPRGNQSVQGTKLREEAQKRLIKEKYPPEYLILLKKSYAVMSETAPKLGHVSFEQRWTQEQVCLHLLEGRSRYG